MSVFPEAVFTSSASAADPFYITGGTLPPEATSYVTRQADTDLYANLRAGEYCYVLNSRQMGKSSLCVRAIGRLRDVGVQTAFVDLTRFGGKNLSVEQWYAGMLSEVGRELGLRSEFLAYWKAHGELSPLQRLFGAIQDVALTKLDTPIVVFVDEIDVTRSLPFSTDEFFAAIRQVYVGRATDPLLKRLAFCLLGTATPAELIQDTRVSPFNIGRRIDLQDFTPAEAAPLANGLNARLNHRGHGEHEEKKTGAPPSPSDASRISLNVSASTPDTQRSTPSASQSLLDRVLYWTGGHPYLTQRLCRAIAEEPTSGTTRDVDRLCHDLFLTHKAKESDDNLAFVRSRLLKSEADLAALLDLYSKMRTGKRAPDDQTNPLCAILKLSGVARVEEGLLQVRNRIYEHVFDRQWAVAHMPDAERRRQRQAFRRGLLLAGGITGTALVIVASLGLLAWRNYRVARALTALSAQRAEQTDYNLYVANMNLIQRDWDNGNVAHAQQLLEATQPRGKGTFEWGYWNRLCHLQLLTLRGHKGLVQAVAFSPDGARIATGGEDQSIRIWEAATGHCLQILRGRSNPKIPDYVKHLAFSPNGSRLLACGLQSVTLWDVGLGTEQRQFPTNSRGVFSAAFAPDGKRILTANSDAALVRDAATGKELFALKATGFAPASVVFSPNGERIAAAGHDRTVRVWDAQTGKSLRILRGNLDARNFPIAFSPDGKRLVTGMRDHTAKIWDAQTGQSQLALTGHTDALADIVFSPDGKRMATGGYDGAVKGWDAQTGKCLYTLKGHAGAANSIAFSPDGKRLVTCGDNTAKVWDATTEQTFFTLDTPSLRIYRAAFAPDGKRLIAVNEDRITLMDAATGKPLVAHKVFLEKGHPAGFSPDGSHIAAERLDQGGLALEWDSAAGKQRKTLPGEQEVAPVVFSPDGKLIAVTGLNTIRILEASTGKERINLRARQGVFSQAVFSLDSRYIATAGTDNTASVWDVVTGTEQRTFRGHEGWLFTVAFSPDGRRIATGSVDQTAKIWDTASGRCLLTLPGHSNALLSIAFSPDGTRLLTCSSDETAKVWDAATGADLLTLKGHTDLMLTAEFSPDGKRIVTASQDGMAKVWYADDTRLAPQR